MNLISVKVLDEKCLRLLLYFLYTCMFPLNDGSVRAFGVT